MMTLYTNALSPNALLVHLVLGELDGAAGPHQVTPIDLRAGEHKTPEFTRLNPNAKVPVLVDGDFALWESNAIARYLADKAGSPLLGLDPRERATVDAWMAWRLAHMDPAAWPYVAENVFAPMRGASPDTARVEAAGADFHKYLGVLNGVLADGRTWICGKGLTLADLAIASGLMYVEAARMPLGRHGHVVAWRDRVKARASWPAG